jgi:hypothetical protein
MSERVIVGPPPLFWRRRQFANLAGRVWIESHRLPRHLVQRSFALAKLAAIEDELSLLDRHVSRLHLEAIAS